MTTLIRTFAIMLALTGFSAATFSGTGSTSGGRSGIHSMDGGPGMSGGPITTCSPSSSNCGLD